MGSINKAGSSDRDWYKQQKDSIVKKIRDAESRGDQAAFNTWKDELNRLRGKQDFERQGGVLPNKSASAVSDPNERIDVVYKDPKLPGTQTVTGIRRSDWEAMKAKENLTQVKALKAGATPSQINAAIESDVVRVANAGGGGTYFSKASLIKAGYKDNLPSSEKSKILQKTYSQQFKEAPKSTLVLRRDFNAYADARTGQVALYRKGQEPFRSTPEGWVKIQPENLRLTSSGQVEAKYVVTPQEKNINTSNANYGEANYGYGNKKSGKAGSGGGSDSMAEFGSSVSPFGSSRASNRNLSDLGRSSGSAGFVSLQGNKTGNQKPNLTEEVGQSTSTKQIQKELSFQGDLIFEGNKRDKDIWAEDLGREKWAEAKQTKDYASLAKYVGVAGTKSLWGVIASSITKPTVNEESKSIFFKNIGKLEQSIEKEQKRIILEEGRSPTKSDYQKIAFKETGAAVLDSPLTLVPEAKAGQALFNLGTKASALKFITPAMKTAGKGAGAGMTGLWGASVTQEVASADPIDRPEIITKELLSAGAFVKGAKQAQEALTFKPSGNPIITGKAIEGGGSEFRLWQRLANGKGRTKEEIFSIVTKPTKKQGVSDYEVTKVYDNGPSFELIGRGKTQEMASISKEVKPRESVLGKSETGEVITVKEKAPTLKSDVFLSRSIGATSEGKILKTTSVTDALTFGKDKTSLFEVSASTKIAEPKTISDEWAHSSVTLPKVTEMESSNILGIFGPKTPAPKTSSGATVTKQISSGSPSVPGEAITKITQDLTAKGVSIYTQPKTKSPIVKATQTKVVSASPVIGIKPSEEETKSPMVLDMKTRQTTKVIGVPGRTQETTPLIKSEELESIQASSLLGTKSDKKSGLEEIASYPQTLEKRARVIGISPHNAQLEGTKTITFFSKDKLEGKKVFRSPWSKVTNIQEQKERKRRETLEALELLSRTDKSEKTATSPGLGLKGALRQNTGLRLGEISGIKTRTGQKQAAKNLEFSGIFGRTSRTSGGYSSDMKSFLGGQLSLNLPQTPRKSVQVQKSSDSRRKRTKKFNLLNPVGDARDLFRISSK